MINKKKIEENIQESKSLKEKNNLRLKKYYEKNKEKIIERTKSYYHKNKEIILSNRKIKNKPKIKFSLEKKKLIKNLLYNINIEYNKQKLEKPKNIEDIIGCTYNDFFIHIENQFNGWVSWKDYGYKKESGHTSWILIYKNKNLEITELNNFNNFGIKIMIKKQ